MKCTENFALGYRFPTCMQFKFSSSDIVSNCLHATATPCQSHTKAYQSLSKLIQLIKINLENPSMYTTVTVAPGACIPKVITHGATLSCVIITCMLLPCRHQQLIHHIGRTYFPQLQLYYSIHSFHACQASQTSVTEHNMFNDLFTSMTMHIIKQMFYVLDYIICS